MRDLQGIVTPVLASISGEQALGALKCADGEVQSIFLVSVRDLLSRIRYTAFRQELFFRGIFTYFINLSEKIDLFYFENHKKSKFFLLWYNCDKNPNGSNFFIIRFLLIFF